MPCTGATEGWGNEGAPGRAFCAEVLCCSPPAARELPCVPLAGVPSGDVLLAWGTSQPLVALVFLCLLVFVWGGHTVCEEMNPLLRDPSQLSQAVFPVFTKWAEKGKGALLCPCFLGQASHRQAAVCWKLTVSFGNKVR